MKSAEDRLYRGSYMSAHVLLILLNELGKRDKMRGLPRLALLYLGLYVLGDDALIS